MPQTNVLRSAVLVALFATAGSATAQTPPPPAQATPQPAQATPPAQAKIELPDNVVEGFNATRFENEYKLTVPDAQVEALWAYMQKRFGAGATLPDASGVHLTVTVGDEFFTDVYFDTPGQQLLRMQSGVRHRSRSIPGQPQNRKDGRELMQVKLNTAEGGLTRMEVKFPIKHYTSIESQEDRHPVLGIIDRDFRSEFSQRVRAVGIDPWKLRANITQIQRRRRLYFSDATGPFATVTLDETSAQKLWLSSKFTEVELELNEIRYSSADAAQRDQMQKVTDAIKADIMKAIPGIVQDQTPKYNKTYDHLAASAFGGGLIMRASILDMKMVGSIAGLAAIVLWGAVALVLRRRREAREALAARTPAGADLRVPVSSRGR